MDLKYNVSTLCGSFVDYEQLPSYIFKSNLKELTTKSARVLLVVSGWFVGTCRASIDHTCGICEVSTYHCTTELFVIQTVLLLEEVGSPGSVSGSLTQKCQFTWIGSFSLPSL